MQPIAVMAFFEELHKISASKVAEPRLVKEWKRLTAAGDRAGADQLAKAYGDLNLNQRYLKNLSTGGAEAAVDLTMGKAMQPNASGYVAKKLYKPDSFVSRGRQTSELLEQKKHYTDTARSLSPEAKAMVPEMYGHKVLQSPQGTLRHISEHEYVPDVQQITKAPNPSQHLVDTSKHVLNPMTRKGMPMGDVGYIQDNKAIGNISNIAHTPSGPKILDFIPQGKDRVVSMSPKLDSVNSFYDVNNQVKYDSKNINNLRKEIYNPQMKYPSVKPEGIHRVISAMDENAAKSPISSVVGPASSTPGVGRVGTPMGTVQNASTPARTLGRVPSVVNPSTLQTSNKLKTLGTSATKTVGTLGSNAAHTLATKAKSIPSSLLKKVASYASKVL